MKEKFKECWNSPFVVNRGAILVVTVVLLVFAVGFGIKYHNAMALQAQIDGPKLTALQEIQKRNIEERLNHLEALQRQIMVDYEALMRKPHKTSYDYSMMEALNEGFKACNQLYKSSLLDSLDVWHYKLPAFTSEFLKRNKVSDTQHDEAFSKLKALIPLRK